MGPDGEAPLLQGGRTRFDSVHDYQITVDPLHSIEYNAIIMNIIKDHPIMSTFFTGGVITSVGIGLIAGNLGAGVLAFGITMLTCATLTFMGQYKDQDFK